VSLEFDVLLMKAVPVFLCTALLVFAADPWNKSSQKWTRDDAQRVLTASPWAALAKPTFDDDDDNRIEEQAAPLPGAAQAGVAGARGATDGHWDGGVGKMRRGSLPTLPILIRWDSALPVREATAKLGNSAAAQDTSATSVGDDQAAKDYVITVVGLVPAKRYRDQGQLSGTSRSDDTVDGHDPEELLEGLMSSTRLLRHGRPALAPENVKLDGATGVVHIFFPRTDPILPSDKDIVFATQFGALTVRQAFRLKDMTYQGRLEL